MVRFAPLALMCGEGATLTVPSLRFLQLGHAAVWQASNVNVAGNPKISRMVWTIFCIPLNEYGLATPSRDSLRIIGTPRRSKCARTAERWGETKGVGADLLIALPAPFREARERELAPEEYPYLNKEKLARQLNCESDEVLRRRVLRCRNAIKKLAKNVGVPEPSIDAIIESSQWHGYRLNPDRVRL